MRYDFNYTYAKRHPWGTGWRKSVKGYRGLYNVTLFGKVWSNPKRRGTNTDDKGHYLKTVKHDSGFLTVRLYKRVGGKSVSKRYYVHKLVAEAFVPNPHGLKYVHHIDGNKLNNHKNNLAWVSQSILQRTLSEGEPIPVMFQSFYNRVARFHGANIKTFLKQGESVESLSVRYRVSEDWIYAIQKMSGLKSKPMGDVVDLKAKRLRNEMEYFDRSYLMAFGGDEDFRNKLNQPEYC